MGSATSTPSSSRMLTKEQQDIKYLGDRMPFGDAELLEVYRAYFARLKLPEKTSFLTDIGLLIIQQQQQAKTFGKEETTTSSDDNLVLLQAVEQRILPPNFGNRLYQTSFLRKQDVSEYDKKNSTKKDNDNEDEDDDYTRLSKLEAFFEGLSNSTRRGGKKSLKVLMDCCERQHTTAATNDNNNDAAVGNNDFAYAATTKKSTSTPKQRLIEPIELVTIGYRVALASAFLQSTAKSNDEHQDISRFFPNGNDDDDDDDDHLSKDPSLVALANSLADFATKRKQRIKRSSTPNGDQVQLLVDEDDLQEWGEHVAPLFGASLASFLHMIFFPRRAYPPTRSNFEYPDVSAFESSLFLKGNSPLLFSLACMSPSLNGQYYRLYTAASDGLSFNRLQNSLLGYGGPTLVIVRSGKSIFGAFTGSAWKESKDFYGNTDCFLFQLQPRTAVYRPTGKDNNFMYCNSFARSRGYDKQAHGIGFGGTVDKPRLFLPESFDDCWAGSQDLTFENGLLLADRHNSNFVIDDLEVWGVGGTDVVQEALGARNRERDIRQANINKARKVDKAAFLDDFRTGLIESKAFAHRGQIRGRESACIDDKDLNNYKYPQS